MVKRRVDRTGTTLKLKEPITHVRVITDDHAGSLLVSGGRLTGWIGMKDIEDITI